ncbi:hypothetical protein N7537_003343 [Penicillium hordei]|uniref:Uncharacterized protein n=1 Tax=Penicillium hordei TaxID=40994 RepID=A0AAD6E9L1_9EURO|nr:uncharacterized protein N7537_003343 [Penicillium hordei]KAJ5606724.1 hypothetical protein N7537_003343 [Penicillium hordei]
MLTELVIGNMNTGKQYKPVDMELSAAKKYTPMTRVRYEQPHPHGVCADPNWYKSMEYGVC